MWKLTFRSKIDGKWITYTCLTKEFAIQEAINLKKYEGIEAIAQKE